MIHCSRKFILLHFWSLLFAFCCISCQPQANPSELHEIKWRTLMDGKQEAVQSNMPVLVDFFYGKECPRCLNVQHDIYDNPEIVEMIESNFIPVRVWLTSGLSPQEEALSKKLSNNGECILAFLDAQGNVIKNLQGEDISSMGMLPAKDYLQYMNDALKMVQ